MKLVAAKCPSCGASIDVDKNSDSTVCEFCHTKIMVEEAIQKMKVEISGSVEISNLPKIENLMVLGDRNYKNFIYKEALEEYKKVLELDPNKSIAILRYGICKCFVQDDFFSFDDAYTDAMESAKDNEELITQLIDESYEKIVEFCNIYVDWAKNSSDELFCDRVASLYRVLKKIVTERDYELEKKKMYYNKFVTMCNVLIDFGYTKVGNVSEKWREYSDKLVEIDPEYAEKMNKVKLDAEKATEDFKKAEEERKIQSEIDEQNAIKQAKKDKIAYKGRFRWWVILIILWFIGMANSLAENYVNCDSYIVVFIVLAVLSVPFILSRITRGKLFLGYLGIIILSVGNFYLASINDIPFLHGKFLYKESRISFHDNRTTYYDGKLNYYYDMTYEKIDDMNYYVYFNDEIYKMTYTNEQKNSGSLCLIVKDKCKKTYVDDDFGLGDRLF